MVRLNPLEKSVLKCIVSGQKRELTVTALAIEPRQYDYIRTRIMMKMECQSDVDLTWTCIRKGWVWWSEASKAMQWSLLLQDECPASEKP